MDTDLANSPLVPLAVALACGLVVGFERGWRGDAGEGPPGGDRIAGIRTFALAGLLGGLVTLADEGVPLLVPAVTLVVGGLLVAGWLGELRRSGDAGMTTEMALLLVFVLGVVAGHGHLLPAIASAVVTATLLGFKEEIHATLGRLARREVQASLQLAVIAAVVLPLLPDRAMGPWDSLNPRTLGLLVLLIAGIGFVGYFAVRVAGARVGLLFTALLGGLTSSTAVAVGFARLARDAPGRAPLLGAGIALACATMGPRLLVEVAAVNRALVPSLVPGVIALTGVPLVAAAWIALRGESRGASGDDDALTLENPLQLRQALIIGVVLAGVFVLSHGADALFGEGGVYALAVISGVADVDAIALALAKQARDGLDPEVATRGILLAAITNTAMKGVYAGVIGGLVLARWASGILAATVLATAATMLLI
jgi:uncharacterized membrane protein (DUF4010 family)